MFGIEHVERALITPDEASLIEVGGSEAAVLIPLRRTGDHSVSLVFTRRPDHLPRHAGEISFPGGRIEPADANFVAAALREAEEELSLPATGVRVIGALPPVSTYVTDFAVYPVIGEIESAQTFTPNAGEVAEVLEFELATLAVLRNREERERGGRRFVTEVFDVDGTVIWGATARIVGILLDRLKSG